MGGKYDVCFRETKVTDVPFDKSLKQGKKESPSLFNVLMMNNFSFCTRAGGGRMSQGFYERKEEGKVTHLISLTTFTSHLHVRWNSMKSCGGDVWAEEERIGLAGRENLWLGVFMGGGMVRTRKSSMRGMVRGA